jgi:hypothetical protein
MEGHELIKKKWKLLLVTFPLPFYMIRLGKS